MPCRVSLSWPGSGGANLFAKRHLFLLMSDLTRFVCPISVLFVIKREGTLPGPLSCLLVVLHLFVCLGIVTNHSKSVTCLMRRKETCQTCDFVVLLGQ